MANTKEYKIVINGVTESINAVKSLNDQLKSLEDRIKALESKSIGVKATSSAYSTGGGSKSSSTGSLSEEEKLERQINQLEEKRVAYSKEIYQNYLAAKDVLSETVKDQKSIAATERLQANAYSNTIQGMKQELADIKSAMQTVDLGDTDQMDKMVQRAKQLTDELKKIEESYGQFGRNVGNYSSAFDGLDKVRITIGGTVREFESAREALRTLNNELKTMALNGQQDTEAFKALQQKVMELESAANDVKKPMDDLMDSMESVMAIANLGQGIRALFGIDDSEIQRSIQKLVALQNVMKGIEAINKQIQTREGIGKWIAPLNAGVDTAAKKLLVLNRALLGTSKAAKVAAVGINVFSKALKVVASAGILIVVDLLIEKLMDLVESFKKVDKAAEATKDAEKEVSNAYAEGSATLLKYQAVVKNFNGSKEEEKRLVNELNGELGDSLGTYSSISEWMDVLTKKGQAYIGMLMLQAKAQAAFNNLVKAQQAEMDAKNSSAEDYRTFVNDVQDFLWTGWGTKSANNARLAAKQSAKAYRETSEEELTKAQTELDKYMQEHGLGLYAPQIKENGNKTKDAVKKVDDELIKLRIRNMKEGLNKVITQLEEERKAELRKIEGNSREAGEKRLEINKYYNNKIREEMKKSAENVENLYKSLEKNIHSYQLKNFNSFIDIINKQVGIQKNELQKVYSNILNQGISSYGIQGKGQLSPGTRTQLGIMSEDKGEFMDDMKELVERYRLLQAYENAYNSLLIKRQVLYNDLSDDEKEFLDGRIKATKESLEEREKLYEEYNTKIIDIYGSEKVGDAFSTLIQENYTERLSTIFHQRYTAYESYWDNIISFVKEASKKEKDYALSAETEEYELRKDNALNYYNEQLKISNDYYDSQKELIEAEYNNGLISESEYYDELRNLEKDYEDKQKQLEANYEAEKINLQKQHEQNEKTIEQNRLKKLQEINKEYYEFRLQELRDFQTAIANLENKQPVNNAWGITNFSKTNENNRNLLDSYETLAAQIVSIKEGLQIQLENNEISFDDFQNANRELDSFAENVGQKMDKVKYKLSIAGQIEQFIQDIQVYVQAASQGLQDILNAVWDYQDYQFEKEQDELDKWNEELDKKLDEQQEIVEKHKNEVDSIEDELATARGDRRQHLIDQLNAEIYAQRAAQTEEQRIQKEKEKAEKKQEQLDKKRKEEEYKRNVTQAFISWHLSIANGLATQPFLPVGIAMGALATTLGAVQYALVKSQKPYAKGGQLDGGVAQGKRHRDGGIPVLGGRASIEGGEFITNRITTQNNVDVLDFINSRHKKLNLDDFVDFYSSGKLKKNISSISPKRVFADGGVIPTISNDIDINDRLITAFEKYSEKPTVVSVVDINNRQNAVKNVQVLAGLSE